MQAIVGIYPCPHQTAVSILYDGKIESRIIHTAPKGSFRGEYANAVEVVEILAAFFKKHPSQDFIIGMCVPHTASTTYILITKLYEYLSNLYVGNIFLFYSSIFHSIRNRNQSRSNLQWLRKVCAANPDLDVAAVDIILEKCPLLALQTSVLKSIMVLMESAAKTPSCAESLTFI